MPIANNTETHEIDESFNLNGFAFDQNALSKVRARERFPAMLVGPYFAIEADAKNSGASVSGLVNADVGYWGLYSYVDLLYLTPASYADSRAVHDKLDAFRTVGASLRDRIAAFDPAGYVHDALAKYYRTIGDLSRQDLGALRQAFKIAYPNSDVLPDSFVVGFDIQDSLDAARCKSFMPDFFVHYHDKDADGSLIRQCALGLQPDSKKTATDLPAKPVDWKDLVVVADALNLVTWQYEDRQNLASNINGSQSPYCPGPHEGGGFQACPVDWTASRSGSDVIRYNAYLNNYVVAYYEESWSWQHRDEKP